MRAAPIPTRSRSSTTTGVPSRSANAPTHIALPAPSSWTNNAFAAFGPSGRTGGTTGAGSVPGSGRGSPGALTPGSLPGTSSAESVALPGTPSRGGPDQQRPVTSPTSPRSSFLPNFIQRTRARSSTLSGRRNQGSSNQPQSNGNQGLSPGQGQPQMTSGLPTANGTVTSGRGTPGLTRSMSTPAPQHSSTPRRDGASTAGPESGRPPTGPTFRIRLVPHLETYRSLHFEPVVRDLEPCAGPERLDGTVLKVGRFTEKQNQALQQQQQQQTGVSANIPQPHAWPAGSTEAVSAQGRDAPIVTAGIDGDPAFNPFTYSATDPAVPAPPTNGNGLTSTVLVNGFPLSGERPATGMGGGGHLHSAKVAFKSKVVSRAHAEIWCEAGGKFFVRDTKSSSGTFLNHIRLSNPNTESRPYPIKDGDIIQLGVDYQGGTEEMYRCVKMKIEVGRERQRGQNNFNKEAMKQLRALGGVPESPTATSAGSSTAKEKKTAAKASVTDCCICLFSVTVQQALFIAPCSHVFHYKCIRPMLQLHHPGFSCPLCRTFHDLEADVELDDAWDVASRRASVRRESSLAADPDHLAIVAISDAESAAVIASEPSELATRTASNEIFGQSLPLAAPLHPTGAANGDQVPEDDPMSSGESSGQVSSEANGIDFNRHNIPAPPTGRQLSGVGMSLGGLPIPGFNDPSTLNNPEYAGLDAATPMNTTFLSTLAESPISGSGMPSLASLGGVPRTAGRLDDVGESEEEPDEVRLREPQDHLYT